MVKIDNQELQIGDLQKGDYISQEVLRTITGHDPYENADVYRLDLLKIKEQIHKERKFESRIEGYAIRILVDSESVFYQERRESRAIRQFRKAQNRGDEIDENNLDEPTLLRHRRNQLNRSRKISALDRESRQISLEQRRDKAPTAMPAPQIKIISLKGQDENGTQTTESETHRGIAADAPQRPDGKPAEPVRQGVEETHQQAE